MVGRPVVVHDAPGRDLGGGRDDDAAPYEDCTGVLPLIGQKLCVGDADGVARGDGGRSFPIAQPTSKGWSRLRCTMILARMRAGTSMTAVRARGANGMEVRAVQIACMVMGMQRVGSHHDERFYLSGPWKSSRWDPMRTKRIIGSVRWGM